MSELDNSIFTDFYRTLNNSDVAIQELFKQITPGVARRRAWTNSEAQRARQILECLVANLLPQCFAPNSKYIAIKLDANEYRPSFYKPEFVTYKLLASIIKGLESQDFIYQHIGYYDRTSRRGKCTRLTITDKLKSFLLSLEFKLSDIKSDYQFRQTVILKDSKRKKLAYEPAENTLAMQTHLLLINELLSVSDINLPLSQAEVAALGEAISNSDEPRSLDLSRHVLYRVFNNSSFVQGGRFYGGWWQQIPERFRSLITIGNEPTVEVDYSETHPRLLYHLTGIEPPFDDCYIAPGFPAEYRESAKTYFNIMLNTTNRSQTIAANRNKIRLPVGMQLEDLEEAFKAMHEPIADKFYTGAGLKLMYHDSNIADSVLVSLARRGITCLPIHDSFIVKASHYNELVSVMKQAYLEHTRFKAKLKPIENVLDVHDPLNNLDILVSANPLTPSLPSFPA